MGVQSDMYSVYLLSTCGGNMTTVKIDIENLVPMDTSDPAYIEAVKSIEAMNIATLALSEEEKQEIKEDVLNGG